MLSAVAAVVVAAEAYESALVLRRGYYACSLDEDAYEACSTNHKHCSSTRRSSRVARGEYE